MTGFLGGADEQLLRARSREAPPGRVRATAYSASLCPLVPHPQLPQLGGNPRPDRSHVVRGSARMIIRADCGRVAVMAARSPGRQAQHKITTPASGSRGAVSATNLPGDPDIFRPR